MVGCGVEDKRGFDRKVMMSDQVAQASGPTSVLFCEMGKLLGWQLLDSLADHLQVEQDSVECCFVVAQRLQVEPSGQATDLSALAIRSST